jgi:hypothetical protein
VWGTWEKFVYSGKGIDDIMNMINNVSEKEISGGAFSLTQLCIATHCKTNVCRIWDFEKGFLETQFIVPN